jgi:hypothetical protein
MRRLMEDHSATEGTEVVAEAVSWRGGRGSGAAAFDWDTCAMPGVEAPTHMT